MSTSEDRRGTLARAVARRFVRCRLPVIARRDLPRGATGGLGVAPVIEKSVDCAEGDYGSRDGDGDTHPRIISSSCKKSLKMRDARVRCRAAARSGSGDPTAAVSGFASILAGAPVGAGAPLALQAFVGLGTRIAPGSAIASGSTIARGAPVRCLPTVVTHGNAPPAVEPTGSPCSVKVL